MSTQVECINMIKQQLRAGEVLDDTILELYLAIPRHEFVPDPFKSFAYSDMQINLAHNQRMMTPLEEARLLQSLTLKGDEIVLEVGTGTGFLTALLSQLAKEVISIDYYAEFTTQATLNLKNHQCTNVELITGNAYRGWIDKAPYDVIVFTGALDELTDTHLLQLLPGGKLFALIGESPILQGQLHQLDHNESWHSSLIFETDLPPLINPVKSKQFVF